MKKTVSARELIQQNIANRKNRLEKAVPVILFLAASISVLTTIGIVLTLIFDAALFFKEVSIFEFFGSADLAPLSPEPTFGILPLINATILSSLIAMCVAIPVGLTAAIYLSEYASDRVRKLVKPMMEVLAGIPTIVYGFFAYSFVTPLLTYIIPNLGAKNVLSPGIVMGIMIIRW